MDDTQIESQEGTEEGNVTLSKEDFDALTQRLDALDGKLQKTEVDKARLEERIAATTKSEQPTEPPPPTREQLQTAVDNGSITEQQMDFEIARQDREKLRAELSAELDKKNAAQRHADKVQSRFDDYCKAVPDLKKQGSEILERVLAEKAELMSMGMSDSLETETVAMRNVCGPLDRVKETTRKRRQTHADTGGLSDAPSGGEKKGGSKWEKGLTEGQITGFKRQLSAGGFKGDDDKFFLSVVETARKQNASRAA